jgi:signal transduction histidine kinase/CHASE3 domain sensor protein
VTTDASPNTRAWPRVLALTLVLLVGSIYGYLQIRRDERQSALVTHSYRVIGELELLLSLAKDMETGQRGYLLTGDSAYLRPYEQANSTIELHLQNYAALTADDHIAQTQLPVLRRHFHDKQEELRTSIAVYDQTGLIEASALVRAGTGRVIMDELRTDIFGLLDHEHQLLDARTHTSRRAQLLARSAPLAAAAAGLLLLAILLQRLHRVDRARIDVLGESESRRLELAKTSQTLQFSLEAANAGAWSWDFPSQAGRWSERQYALYDMNPATAAPDYESWLGLLHPEDRGATGQNIDTVLNSTTTSLRLEFRVPTSADPRWLLAIGTVERNAAGAPLRISGITLDVTRQKAAAAELAASERRNTELLAFAPMIAWASQPGGSSSYLNPRWYDYTGQPAGTSSAGREAAIHSEDIAKVREWTRSTATVSTPLECVYRIRRHDGEYRWFHGRMAPQLGADGTAVRWYGIAADIHDAKLNELQLQAQDLELREADVRKNEFLAILAHELRNPLAPIRSAAMVLRQPTTDAQSREWAAAVVERQVKTMARLLDDLLDISRISRGTLKVHTQRVRLDSIIDDAVEIVQPMLEARKHTLVQQRPDQPVELEADAVRLAQILTNLLTNAVKFTDAGGRIELRAQLHHDSLHIEIIDNGIGLDPAVLGSIFDLFSQVDSALERTEGGLGIGLALVKGLTTLHRGTVQAHSAGLGHGSKFLVVLPLASAS